MRKYILMAYNITGMGGGQQYVYNKVKYLTAKGYNTTVFSQIRGELVIRDFLRFNTQIIPALKYAPTCFSEKYREHILEILAQGCEDAEEVLIESVTGVYETQWAELLAKRVNGKHICFNLQEQQNKTYSKDTLAFLYFKYQRKELYGIVPESVGLIFKGIYEIADSADYRFVANCINVVDKTMEYTGPVLPKADYRIGCIWRTNKEGFLQTIYNLIPFIEEHPQSTFSVVVIGNGSPGNEEKAAKCLEAYKNVQIVFLGYMYPIPLELLKKMDVFISTAGSASVSAMYDIPTISVTTKSSEGTEEFIPIGILNYTTIRAVVPERSDKSLRDYLQMVLFENYCTTHPNLGKKWLDDEAFDKEYQRELSFFDNIREKRYYPVEYIRPQGWLEKGYCLVGRIFGCRVLSAVDSFCHRIKSLKN